MRVLAALFWLWPALAFAFGTPKPLPILDQLSTMATVCPSVRIVERAGYGQPILYERRSSDNATRAVYYQPNGMLDQYDAAAFAGSGSGYVTQWNSNCSPRIAVTGAYDATQSTAASQPQIVASGVVETQNGGVPAIASYNTYLVTSSGLAILDNNGDFTSNVVSTTPANRPFLTAQNSSAQGPNGALAYFVTSNSTGIFQTVSYSPTGTAYSASTSAPTSGMNIFTSTQGSGALTVFLNGVQKNLVSTSNPTQSYTATLYIGGFPGQFSAAVSYSFAGIWTAGLSASDRQNLEIWEGKNFNISGVTQ